MSTAAPVKSKRLPLILILLAALGGGWWWHQHSQNAKEAAARNKGGAPVAVGVAAVQAMDAPLQLNALGTVTSAYTVTVRSRVDGQLEKVHFAEGQQVKQGQLLAELDARSYQAALTQAEGQLLRDQALLENARLDLARYQQLASQNSIAKQQVDTQQALVRQYQGTVKVDQGAVAAARVNVDYTRVTAPISGRVGLRQVDPGNIVHASDANGLVTITQTQPINVTFAIPEVSLSPVLQAARDNKTLKVEAWDRDNRHKLADGKLLALDNQLNTSTGTINIKATFANEQQQLFPNQFVNVNLQLGVRKDAVVVPTAAVQLGKMGNYVYTVGADSMVSIAKVKTGPVSGSNTIIEEGLRPGQQVVIDGVDKLRDGAKVKVIDRAAQAREAASAAAGEAKGHKPRGGKQHASAAH
ncbi:MdtA/MuxA family multidrug efflux RND transporter periplasmic adaptor subunit [Chromobacterium violaceum]|uniref:MdtA/MuxA family multidrug efflux RND transporter periplasmic adaptor subunit n=1 Tax=Chromobacterium violaceum TaxID=536 RepID=UPI0009D9C8FB|nr:MdtA/MuxA family multidrug efflux RND transporter periplasmic adaptor subunit [Chromobacterium violaceum]OQS45950.1 multidrug transporter subunit MdtA [Chromobacterium violaceum]OQS47918.1 multidrug transporter subunit MdtA [Chromobacterium violaceum]QRO33649.1 MdtA/MuxA family multidrug efflux RND transporter periplasmic adaptor subunit [Chromobacterium violaceum]QRQ16547.1 MdtA/MuxA family multidrug efflux RND transporter periplasmic adaptor subunit [Chromobacterium violaceum]